MKNTGIYKIQSIIKPIRCYIGSAIDIKDRWRCHLKKLRKRSHHSIKFQNHFNKYGEKDLQFSILLGCKKEDLIKHEQFFIDAYNPWFNCSPTAGNCLGVKHSDEYKEKIRKITTGKYPSKETREKLSALKMGEKNHFFGKHHTEESKQKISKNRKGKGYHSDEWKKEQSKRMNGKNHHQFGKKHSAERLLIDSKSQLGKIASIETKEKMSKSGKKAWLLRKQLNIK